MPSRDAVIDLAVKSFCETIKTKMKLFRGLIPPGANSDITGKYVEALVRNFVRYWIGDKKLLHGTFLPSDNGIKQLDGIIYDSRTGPAILLEDDFILVNPAFCCGVIEIKTTESSISTFYQRLKSIYVDYHLDQYDYTSSKIIGIVIEDDNPELHSQYEDKLFFDINLGAPRIFILFKVNGEDYVPYEPAIRAMIRHIYLRMFNSTNFLT